MAFFNKILCGIFFLIFIISCTGKHLVSDRSYMDKVERSFLERKILAQSRSQELFSVFERELSVVQSEALKFLFAYMPLSDLADYTGEFFLANADRSIAAIERVPWGKSIPEDIFLHYVLPCRVNNENLDSFRIVYFDEIHERIKGKELLGAALEINYWCHEKVAYQPADIRTSSPMSTILSARGRCGEESTFTVAALRTAGIPARQVYTPRWAHIDDNHAWVEVWIDGEWHYMGACEPEPVLDRGWFTDYASRAMLVHTKSFGAPYGNENVINVHKNFTEVNNLAKYASTKRVYVRVLDSEGKPAEGAKVDFRIYNYAEFYPLTSIPADSNGLCSLETGLGDLLIWASSEKRFDWKKVSVAENDTVELRLRPVDEEEFEIDLDIFAPPELPPFPGISEDLTRQNALRIDSGNFIRQSYISSWIKDDEIKNISEKLGVDHQRLKVIFSRSMGNYEEIRNFLFKAPDSLISRGVDLLEVLPDKDLRDTRSSILSDHLLRTLNKTNDPDLFRNYVLNSRIANEMMIPWRSYFLNNLPENIIRNAPVNPELLTGYLNKEIIITEDENYYNTPLTPIGVNKLKVSDIQSRAICFVAMCRTLGIPSRLEPGRNIPQYWKNEKWIDVIFADQVKDTGEKGIIRLVTGQDYPVPLYSTHFTLARFEDGQYNTLEYDFNKKVTEFPELELPPGNYMLITGNRPDKKVIYVQLSFFSLAAGEKKKVEVNLRPAEAASEYTGTINIEAIKALLPQETKSKITFKNGLILAWIEPDQEPTRHVFTDLPPVKQELDKWGGWFVFMTGSEASSRSFDADQLTGLPEKSLFTSDPNLEKLKGAVSLSPAPQMRLPFIVLADKNGKVLFVSSGYRIGIGEQLLRHLKQD